MNHKFLFSLSTLGLLTGLTPLNAYAQTFYQCMPCKAGTRNVNGKCEACPAGTYNTSTGSSSCVDCGYGTYASTTGNTSCSQCSPGYYADYRGAKSCTACPAGTYNNKYGATSSADCTPCPDYQWSNKGSSKCNWTKLTLWKADWDKDKQALTFIAPGTFYLKDLYNMPYGCGCENFGNNCQIGVKKSICCETGNRSGDCGGVNGLHIWEDGNKITLDCKRFPCEVKNGKGRGFRIGEDGTVYNRLRETDGWSSLGYKATWD